jgi:integrase
MARIGKLRRAGYLHRAKALRVFMGHSSSQVTFDLYGHLMPNSEAEAAALLDAYLVAQRERAEDAARGLAGARVAHG